MFSYDSHLNTSNFFGNVHVRVAPMIFFSEKNMFTLNMLNAFYRRALSVNSLVYILLFSINLHFIPVSFFFIFENCVMVFFVFLYFIYLFLFFFFQNALF